MFLFYYENFIIYKIFFNMIILNYLIVIKLLFKLVRSIIVF